MLQIFLNNSSPKCFLELKLSNGIDDAHRHQMSMYLKSIQKNNNLLIMDIKDGYLINFLKLEPIFQTSQKKTKELNKIEIEHLKLDDNQNIKIEKRIVDSLNINS